MDGWMDEQMNWRTDKLMLNLITAFTTRDLLFRDDDYYDDDDDDDSDGEWRR